MRPVRCNNIFLQAKACGRVCGWPSYQAPQLYSNANNRMIRTEAETGWKGSFLISSYRSSTGHGQGIFIRGLSFASRRCIYFPPLPGMFQPARFLRVMPSWQRPRVCKSQELSSSNKPPSVRLLTHQVNRRYSSPF